MLALGVEQELPMVTAEFPASWNGISTVIDSVAKKQHQDARASLEHVAPLNRLGL